MQINPMSEEFAPTPQPNRTRYVTEGRKVLAPIGFTRGKSSLKGTPYLELGFVCVKDLDGNGEEGAVTTRKFWITPAAVAQFAKFIRALGCTTAFDTDVDDDLDRVLSTGYVQAFCKTETYTKRDGSEGASTSPAFFDTASGEQPEWEDEVRNVGDWWSEYVRRAQERAAQYGNNDSAQAAPVASSDSSDIPF